MVSRFKCLRLLETYELSVLVEDGGEQFIGKLSLTPERSSITIVMENSKSRKSSNINSRTDQITCTWTNETFILQDLSQIRLNSKRAYSEGLGSLWISEIEFEIGFVCFWPFNVEEKSVQEFRIHSRRIGDWIGTTKKQQDIVDIYECNSMPIDSISDNTDTLLEFSEEIPEIGTLRASYHWTAYQIYPEHKTGLSFPPSINLLFYESQIVVGAYSTYQKVYNLLAFILGGDFIVDKVDIVGDSCSKTGSLYYSTEKIWSGTQGRNILWPLGKSVFHTERNKLPPFPTSCFAQYFSLSEEKTKIWEKYLRYRRMSNSEERFLGYFRLLERLCKRDGGIYIQEALLHQ